MSYIKKMRSIIGHEELLLAGVSVLIFDEENRILLLYRADTKDWGVPGGYIEIGETFEEAAHREVMEETGLFLNELLFYKVFSGPDFAFIYPNGDKVYNVVSCYISKNYDGEIKLDMESTEHQFFYLDDLPKKMMSHSRIVIESYMNKDEKPQ